MRARRWVALGLLSAMGAAPGLGCEDSDVTRGADDPAPPGDPSVPPGASAGDDAPARAGCVPSNVPVHQRPPPGNAPLFEHYAFYPRVIRLEHSGPMNGTLVATVVTNNGHWVGSMFQSADNGRTFQNVGAADDPLQATGMCCHTLYELPSAVGAMPAGTLIWGASFGADAGPGRRMSERLWKSNDHGKTWSFLSVVHTATTSQGTWEPELTVSSDGHLVVFYSDETDPAHSQKLVAARSTDGIVWTDAKSVVALPEASARPGMAVVRRLPDASYLMSYELCGEAHLCEAYVRRSPDGWSWGDPTTLGERVLTADGRFPASSPTITVAGSTVVINAMRMRNADTSFAAIDGRAFLANADGGRGPWFEVTAPVALPGTGGPPLCSGYSNPVLGLADGKAVLQIGTAIAPGGQCRAFVGSAPVVPVGGDSLVEGARIVSDDAGAHVFGRSPRGALRRWTTPDGGAAGETWAEGIAGEPVAIPHGAQQHAFARSTAGSLVHAFVDAADPRVRSDVWAAAGVAGDPATLVVGDAQHVWAVDSSASMRHWWWSPARGIQTDSWGSRASGRPSVFLASGAQHLFMRTTSGTLEHHWWHALQGAQHEVVQPVVAGDTCEGGYGGDPAAASIAGAEHVWVIDDAAALQHLWWTAREGWQRETWGQGLVGRPSFLGVGDAQHVFARSLSGALEHFWWNPAQGLQHDTWSKATRLAGDPSAALVAGAQQVVASGADGAVHAWSWTPETGIVETTLRP